MKNKRLYLFPVLVFIVALIMRIGIWFFVWNYMNSHPYRSAAIRNLTNFWAIFWPLVFFAEIVIYIAIRKKLVNRNWVLIHASFSLLAFVIIPLVYGLLPIVFRMRIDEANVHEVLLARKYLFWFAVLVGHLFFILTIIKSIGKNDITSNETPGILDEFVS